MTDKEALHWFNHNGATFDEEKEMDKLIEIALTKQIPRKVGKSMIDYYCPATIFIGKNGAIHLHCPTCNVRLKYDTLSDHKIRCQGCGQKIDLDIKYE